MNVTVFFFHKDSNFFFFFLLFFSPCLQHCFEDAATLSFLFFFPSLSLSNVFIAVRSHFVFFFFAFNALALHLCVPLEGVKWQLSFSAFFLLAGL